MGQKKYQAGFDFRFHPDSYAIPIYKIKPTTYFVDSMSDLFHEKAPAAEIIRVFRIMNATPWHTYQVLTKRTEAVLAMSNDLEWSQNIWMGTSVESNDQIDRIQDLRWTPAAVRFLSLEPLLGPIDDLDLTGIHWVIAGGESGPNARPMDPDWVRDIRDQCGEANVPFFFKQWGGRNKKKAGRILDGREWSEFPNNDRK